MLAMHGKSPCLALVAAALVVIFSTGCHPDQGTVVVHGRVRFDGGPPPAECAVIFAPVSTDGGTRPGAANCAADGSFRAGSYRAGDGLLPGRYRAVVRCLRELDDETAPPQSHVPADFVPPEFDVPAEGKRPVQLDIEITSSATRSSWP